MLRSCVSVSAHMLAKEWGTELLAPDELFGPMATVRLPGPLLVCDCRSILRAWLLTVLTLRTLLTRLCMQMQNDHENNDIQDRLHFEYGIEVPIKQVRSSSCCDSSAFAHYAGAAQAVRAHLRSHLQHSRRVRAAGKSCAGNSTEHDSPGRCTS